MIDEFVQVVYEKKAKEDHISKLASSMQHLPVQELKKIARFGLMDTDKSWLDKYKGTPLFDKAVELEQQSLQMEMQRIQSDQDRQLKWRADDQMRAAEDQLCVQKRMLDLELASQENLQAGAGMGMMQASALPASEGVEAPAPELPPEAVKIARLRYVNALNRMRKEAGLVDKYNRAKDIYSKHKDMVDSAVDAAKDVRGTYKDKGVDSAIRDSLGRIDAQASNSPLIANAIREAEETATRAVINAKRPAATSPVPASVPDAASGVGNWIRKNPGTAGVIGGLGTAGAIGGGTAYGRSTQ